MPFRSTLPAAVCPKQAAHSDQPPSHTASCWIWSGGRCRRRGQDTEVGTLTSPTASSQQARHLLVEAVVLPSTHPPGSRRALLPLLQAQGRPLFQSLGLCWLLAGSPNPAHTCVRHPFTVVSVCTFGFPAGHGWTWCTLILSHPGHVNIQSN